MQGFVSLSSTYLANGGKMKQSEGRFMNQQPMPFCTITECIYWFILCRWVWNQNVFLDLCYTYTQTQDWDLWSWHQVTEDTSLQCNSDNWLLAIVIDSLGHLASGFLAMPAVWLYGSKCWSYLFNTMVYELMPDKSHQMYISPLHYDYHDQIHNNAIAMISIGNLRKMNNATCEIDP